MPLLLVLKLALVPSLIGLVTLSGRRWGATVAGWLSSLPIVAGPILFIIASEQGVAFASAASVATLSAVLAIVAFALAYSWAALRWQWPGSVLCALAVYGVAVFALKTFPPSLAGAALLDVAALLAAPHLFPKVIVPANSPRTSYGELPLRMAAGALVVLSVTYFSANLGPRLSGIFAMFPVMGTVLAVFSHHYAGREFAIKLLQGTILGWYAFCSFCIVLSLSLPVHGMVASFGAAAACAVLAQAVSRRFMRA